MFQVAILAQIKLHLKVHLGHLSQSSFYLSFLSSSLLLTLCLFLSSLWLQLERPLLFLSLLSRSYHVLFFLILRSTTSQVKFLSPFQRSLAALILSNHVCKRYCSFVELTPLITISSVLGKTSKISLVGSQTIIRIGIVVELLLLLCPSSLRRIVFVFRFMRY